VGKGVIVGDIDFGFWLESLSFFVLFMFWLDDVMIVVKWYGICDLGIEDLVICNNKVIGVCWYDLVKLFMVNLGEYFLLCDFDGYGLYIVSIVVGNFVVYVFING